jgi:hypothetical protein
LFVRRFKKVGKVQVKSFEWIVDDFSNKKYSSYWYSKTIGQAKIAGGIIEI